MDYEKKYKDALERAKNLHKDAIDMEENRLAKQCEIIFPELEESEDEKIRKALIKGVESCKASGWTNFGNNVDIDIVLAWLKEQVEQKPIDYNKELKKCRENPLYFFDKYVKLEKQKPAWSEEDENYLQSAENACEYQYGKNTSTILWLKSLKDRVQPKQEWSEEDERICQCLIKDQEESLDEVRNDKYGHSEIISDLKEMYRERINWLKSLKERIKGKED